MKKITFTPLLAITILSMVGCNNKKCSFVFEGTNCFMENEKSYDKGTQLTLKIGTYSDYVLPKSLTVEGSDNFVYIRETGEFKVTINNDIKVICAAISPDETYSFSFQGLNCSSNSLKRYEKNEEVEIVIKSNDTYDLPYKISCTGFENYSFNKPAGLFKGKIVSDASLQIVASKNPEYQYVYKQYEYNQDHIVNRTITYNENIVDGKKEIFKTSEYFNHSSSSYAVYKYDTSDRLIKEENGQFNSGSKSVFNNIDYSYDDDGRLIEMNIDFTEGSNQKSVYSYGTLPNGYYREEAIYKEGGGHISIQKN